MNLLMRRECAWVLLITAMWWLGIFSSGPIMSQVEIKHKIMIIPFEPRLYMSQVDQIINRETKLSQKEIRNTFRRGISDLLFVQFKKKYEVINLLQDTVKYGKLLGIIYERIGYSFDKVPEAGIYKAPVSEKESKNKNVTKGQLTVESDPTLRFMNVKIKDGGLVPGLFGKYKTDVYVFISQLDLLSNAVAQNDIQNIVERRIAIHYSVYTVDAKEIQSGLCSIKFPDNCNQPGRILSEYIKKICVEISGRIMVALQPPDEKKK